MTHSMKEGLQFFSYLGGAYGIIFLIWVIALFITRQWKMALTVLGMGFGVVAVVGWFAASIAWPIFGLAWSIPAVVVGYFFYLRSECQRAKAGYCN